MFQYDENLFIESENNVSETLNILREKQSAINILLNMNCLEYSTSIDDLYSILKKTIQNLEDLDSNMIRAINISNNSSVTRALSESETDIQHNILNELNKIAEADTQIDTSSVFANFTDFQNVMMSNLSFLELFYGDNLDELKGKTIGELFLETYDSDQNYTIDDYLSFTLDTDIIISLKDENEQKKYRNLFLGKLCLYGFSNLKINELINGEDGFDAIVIEDNNGDKLIYFSCTDLGEVDDFLYDAYPILSTLSNAGELLIEELDCERIYKSQQRQALELVEKYLNEGDSKVNVGGFSLGGSLAEYSYFSVYGSDNLGGLILFNPYHIDVDENTLKNIVDDNKLKLYASEGDAVSTILGYETFSKYTTPVFIDYENVIEDGKILADSDDNLLNRLGTDLINGYFHEKYEDNVDHYDGLADEYESKWVFLGPLIAAHYRSKAKNENENKVENVDAHALITLFSQLTEIEKLEYIEILFSGVHMPYSVEINRLDSFDEKGNVSSSVNEQSVEYPSFGETSEMIFDSNIYDDIKDIVYEINDMNPSQLMKWFFNRMENVDMGLIFNNEN